MLAILLGVTALVAIRHVTVFSERAVARQLRRSARTFSSCPKGRPWTTTTPPMHGQTLPEEHVTDHSGELAGVEKLSPKLCVPARLEREPVTLTGILPQSEFQAKAAWQSVGIFTKSTSAARGRVRTVDRIRSPDARHRAGHREPRRKPGHRRLRPGRTAAG